MLVISWMKKKDLQNYGDKYLSKYYYSPWNKSVKRRNLLSPNWGYLQNVTPYWMNKILIMQKSNQQGWQSGLHDIFGIAIKKVFGFFVLYFQFLIWTARSVAFIASNGKKKPRKTGIFFTKEYKNVRWIRSKNQASRADRDCIGWELEKVWGEACNIGLGNTGLFKNGWEDIPTLIYPPQDNLGRREH